MESDAMPTSSSSDISGDDTAPEGVNSATFSYEMSKEQENNDNQFNCQHAQLSENLMGEENQIRSDKQSGSDRFHATKRNHVQKSFLSSGTSVSVSDSERRSEQRAHVISTTQSIPGLGPSVHDFSKPETITARNERQQTMGHVRIVNGKIVLGPEGNSSTCSDGMPTEPAEYLPVILDVRGNANDLDVIEEFDHTSGEQTVGTRRQNSTPVSCEAEKVIGIGVDKILMEKSGLAQGNQVTTYASDPPVSTKSVCFKSNKTNPSMSVSSSSNPKLPSNHVTAHLPSTNKSVLIRSEELETVQHPGCFAGDSVSENETSVSQLKEAPNVNHQSQSGTKIHKTNNDEMAQPRYTISLLKPFQNPSASGTKDVTSSGVNSFSDSENARHTKALSYQMNPNITATNVHPPTAVTPTVSIDTQRSRSITTPTVNTQQQKHPSSVIQGLDNYPNSDSETNQTQSMCSLPSKFYGMNKQEIIQSGLLNVAAKPRPDPTKHHVCSVCGDGFHSEEFLQFHLERTVFVLTYFCSQCVKTMTFHNKCSFWQHIRTEVTGSEENIHRLRTENAFIRLDPYLAPNVQKGSPVTPSKSSGSDASCNNQVASVKSCSYCPVDCSTPSLSRSHFQRVDDKYACNICDMILFNPCSLAAHKSIHTMEMTQKSISCPECGEDLPYSQDRKPVFEHLDLCSHFNVSHILLCKCGEEVTSINNSKEHVLNRHLLQLFHCCVCNQMFSNMTALSSHHRSHHSQVVFTSSIFVLCTLCKTFLTNPSALQAHVEREVSTFEIGIKKVYKCSLCHEVFPSANNLTDHIDKLHTHNVKRCTLCFAFFQSRQNLVRHLVSKSCPKKLPKRLHLCLDIPFEKELVAFNKSRYTKLFQIRSLDTLPQGANGPAQKADSQVSVPQNSTIMPCVVMTSSSMPSDKPSMSQPAQTKFPPQSTHSGKRISVTSHASDSRKFQCHSCRICLVGLGNFDKHMSHHRSSGLKTGRTHCVVCKKMVADAFISAHLTEHQKHGVIVCSLCHRRDFATMRVARDHSKNWCYYETDTGWGEAHIRRKQIQEQVLNVATDGNGTEQGEKQFQGQASLTTFDGDDSGNNADKGNGNLTASNSNVNQPLVFPCLMCGLAFTTEQAKNNHVNRVHDGTKTLFFCLLCKRKGTRKAFNKRHKASLHISRKHRIMTASAISKFVLEQELNILNGETIPGIGSAQVSTDAPPPKRLRLQAEGSFLCGKCGFSDSQKDVFEQHIKTHNPKSEPQCPECGLCFTVNAALRKHVFAVHKIKDVDKYLEERGIENTTEEPISENELSDSSTFVDVITVTDPPPSKPCSQSKKISLSKPISPWECNVCYKKFTCEVVLKSHMRTHGMAFIRSRRHQKKSIG